MSGMGGVIAELAAARATAVVLAIDPGTTHSGFAVINTNDCRPIEVGKVPNDVLRARLSRGSDGSRFHSCGIDVVAIEMISSYGMAVGREVFETVVWVGRYLELAGAQGRLVYRRDVKQHLCGTSKAKDANIIQALIDRFASGQPNHGKGTKTAPGFFYGFRADIWQAMALAVTVADDVEGRS